MFYILDLCGEKLKLTSDGKQDFCIMMHTTRTAAKYELKQNSPFAANNILDEITLKVWLSFISYPWYQFSSAN